LISNLIFFVLATTLTVQYYSYEHPVVDPQEVHT
jgi:hypothetical protein